MKSRWNARRYRLLERDRSCMVLMWRLVLLTLLLFPQLSLPFSLNFVLALQHRLLLSLPFPIIQFPKFLFTVVPLSFRVHYRLWRLLLHGLSERW